MEIDAAKASVIAANNLTDAYVRPIAWRGSEAMSVAAPTSTIHLAIAAWDWPSYFDPTQRMKGIRLDIADYRRPDPRTAPSLAKASGPYEICTISRHRAERKGYSDAMMLDWEGRVAECTAANIFFIRDGALHTPIADAFLDGITRKTVLELARRRGMPAVERRILPEELSLFTECFITGSAAEVTPVSEIGPYTFTPARPNPAAGRRLLSRSSSQLPRRVRRRPNSSRNMAALGSLPFRGALIAGPGRERAHETIEHHLPARLIKVDGRACCRRQRRRFPVRT